MKAHGRKPSETFFRALGERAAKLARTEDVIGIKTGQPVKVPAIDWDYLAPTQLEMEEADNHPAGDMSGDVITAKGMRQLREIAVKNDELVYSTQASYGDEWVPTLMNAQLVLMYLRPDAIPTVDYYATGDSYDWIGPNPPTQAEFDAAVIPAAKHFKIAAIRTEARQRIEATYPEWRQRSAALGVYPPEYVAQMQEGIAAVIAASNAGEDAVDAAVDVAAVEAVTVTWPVL